MNTMSPPKARASCQVPFEFLAAKLRGRRSRLWEGRRLRDLSRERTVGDLALRLFPREDVPDAIGLERHLLAGCVRELGSMDFYLAEAYHDFYIALLARYAVENLKVILRLFQKEGGKADPSAYLVELPRELSIPVEKLLGSADVKEFIMWTPLEAVAACAREALPLYVRSQRKAYLEVAFDKGYWLGVWEKLGRLPAEDREQCSVLLRCEFEAMRVLGTLRAAATYHIPWEEWQALLPRLPGETGSLELRRIHGRPELELIREQVPWARHALRRFVAPGEVPDFARLEEALWQETARLANRQYYTATSAPAILVSYFYLKRHELRRLMALTQMVRYGGKEDEIAAYLET